MEVILLERITRLGGVGDVVQVKNGYARNYLIPQKKVLRATEANKKIFEARRAEIEKQNAEKKAAAEAIAAKLDGTTFKMVRQASQEGKLYGSIAVRDVFEELKEAGHEVQKSQIVMGNTIKNTGEYKIRITLHAEVNAEVTLKVERHEVDAG